MRVEFLGARCSRWLNRAGRLWSVREDGVALEGSQRWLGRKHCLPQPLLEILPRNVEKNSLNGHIQSAYKVQLPVNVIAKGRPFSQNARFEIQMYNPEDEY